MRQHHGAILHNVEGCIDIIANDFGWDDEVFLSFLPALLVLLSLSKLR